MDFSIPTAQVNPTMISKVNTSIQMGLVVVALCAPIFDFLNHPAYLAIWWAITPKKITYYLYSNKNRFGSDFRGFFVPIFQWSNCQHNICLCRELCIHQESLYPEKQSWWRTVRKETDGLHPIHLLQRRIHLPHAEDGTQTVHSETNTKYGYLKKTLPIEVAQSNQLL